MIKKKTRSERVVREKLSAFRLRQAPSVPGNSGQLFFFFKQKTAYEIRYVTGVQTCALPIYLDAPTVERLVPARGYVVDPDVVIERTGAVVNLGASVDEHLPSGIKAPDQIASPVVVVVEGSRP